MLNVRLVPRVAILVAVLGTTLCPPLAASESDDTLRYYLSKSDLAVAGTLASEPVGVTDEDGIVHYICDLKVLDVLAGSLSEKRIQVDVVRHELKEEDRLPYLRKGADVVLFLAKAGEGATPAWKTADLWFGVQFYNSALARAVPRVARTPAPRAAAGASRRPVPDRTGTQPAGRAPAPAAKVASPPAPPARPKLSPEAAAKVQAVCQAATRGDVERLTALLERDPELVNLTNKAGFAPLHYTAMAGREKAAALLLEKKADVNVRQAEFRGTPLQYAASAGHKAVAEVLIKGGAEVDAKDTHDRTPLMWAATEGHTDVVKLLLEKKADVNAATDGGWTPLHYAAGNGRAEIMTILIDAGGDPGARNKQGLTPADVKARRDAREEMPRDE